MAMLAIPLSRDISRLFTQVDVPGARDPSDHITLFFLGDEIPIETVGKLVPIIHQVTSELRPFMVSCKRITTFPKGENGYPVIAQLQAPQLQEIREKVKRIFDRKGINYDNETHPEFNPHVTLSYSKKKPKNISFPKIQWQVNELALFGGDGHDERVYVNFPFSLGIERKGAYIERLADRFAKMAG